MLLYVRYQLVCKLFFNSFPVIAATNDDDKLGEQLQHRIVFLVQFNIIGRFRRFDNLLSYIGSILL